MTAPTLPLAGLRVLELGNFIAAPTAGRLLADFGAEVVKVERPKSGDELRRWRLHAGTTSMLYRTINRNKLSVALDLRSDVGREAVLQMVAHCDAVIENFRPGTLERWGLGPDELRAVKPDLVMARISAFGQTGPRAQEPGFAAVAEAVGGLRAVVGDPDRPPVRTGISIGDTLAGLYAAFGVVTALLAAQRAEGAVTAATVDVALTEAVLSVMESLVPDYVAHGVERQRLGGLTEGVAPSNSYPCAAGGTVVIAGNGDAIFKRFMELIDRPDLRDDPDLVTNDRRWRRRVELDEAIAAWTGQRQRDDVLGVLEAAGVPAGPIYSACDIINDKQFQARGMVQYFPVAGVDVPEVGFPGVVPVLGDESLPIRHVGPDLGEHTAEVLTRLTNLPADVVAELMDEGIAR
ncbi:MAG: hypothetical protein QOH68_872 [Nocardioidaceae bacterium]|nr:hypothetical protein [Nocardioidaceae bacterium]